MFQAILKQQNLARVAFHARVRDNFMLFPSSQPFGQLLVQFSAASRPAVKVTKQASVVSKIVRTSAPNVTVPKNVKKNSVNTTATSSPKDQPNNKLAKEEVTLSDPLSELVKLNSTPGKYTGERHEGKAHGRGKLVWDDHNYYVGDFIAGNRTGTGKFHSRSVTYEGEWVNNKPQGQGTLTGPSGLSYTGTFVAGSYHGPGVYKRGDYVYTGSFARGQRHGQGSAVSAYGAYEGNFKEGMRHGTGRLTRGNDRCSMVYEGGFANDVYSGVGECSYTVHTTANTTSSSVSSPTNSSIDSLIGSNLNDVTHTYKGEFSNGLKHGRGVYASAEVSINGTFSLDAPQGVCEVVHSSGATYRGALERGAMHGYGVHTRSSGEVYEGMFSQNVREGQGKVTFSDGSGHSGVFKNSKLIALLSSTVRTPQGVYTGALLTTTAKNNTNTSTHANTTTNMDTTTKKSIMHGQGRLEGPHGVWEGEFNRGRLYTGSGVYTDKKGVVFEGVWHQGKWAGYGVKKGAVPASQTAQTAASARQGPRNIVRVEKDGVVYEGEMHRGAWHGQGTVIYPDGTKYTGSFDENRRSGYGELTHPDGSTLTGVFRHNRIYTGSGVVKHSTHAEYGTWQDGVRVGSGKNVKSNGDVYEGTFVNGELVVSSMTKHSNGGVYKGECVDYVRHGQGELLYPDQSTYVGSFERGKRGGYGVHTSTSGVYSGMYVDDQQHGQGQYVFTNGDKYVGNFVRGVKHGQGVFTFAKGGVYEGEWRNGRQEGLGKHTNSDGTTYEGRFKEGGIVSGTRVYKDGAVYVGGFARARKHGEGKFTLADGSVYCGTFEFGVPASPGKVVYSSGEYTGEILHYKPHGQGVFVYNNGSVYEGSFEHGNREGVAVITHPDNSVLRGRFIFDKLYTGTGAVRHEDGSVFYGEVDNYLYSTGRLTYADGTYCEGTFVDNAIYNGTGSGVVSSVASSAAGSAASSVKGGAVFTGTWSDGRPVGSGVVRYGDGSVYTGDFTGGVRNGEGTLESCDGSVYRGTFVDDARTGLCTHTMPDGRGGSVEYSGAVVDGVYCGQGSLRTSEGVFEGSWDQGQLQGACKYTDKHGGVISGEYVQGRREGVHTTVYNTGYRVELTYLEDSVVQSDSVHVRDGVVYEGALLNNAYHGSGTLTYPDGRQFVGEFKQGKPYSGSGAFVYNDGTAFSGSFVKGAKHGQGVFSYKGTVVFDGLWANDKPVDV